jgi:hypothetical protein
MEKFDRKVWDDVDSRKDPVRYKIIVDKCLYIVNNFKYIDCEIFLKMKRILIKSKIVIKYWEFWTTLLNQIWSRNLQELKYVLHCLSPFFHTEAKSVPLEKIIYKKKIGINWDKICFQKNIRVHNFFYHKSVWRNYEKSWK